VWEELYTVVHNSVDHDRYMKRGKLYRSRSEKIEKGKAYPASEALQLVCENPSKKFDESVEVHVRLDIDPKKGDQQVRGAAVLPHGTGKKEKIAVMTSTAAQDAKEAGADLIIGEELVEMLRSGQFFSDGYTILVATPEMMPKLAPIAKILGPRGFMPSPKSDTVTTKVKEVVEMLKKGKITFKNDNTGNVHQVIGKVSFGTEKLTENYTAFMEALNKVRPAGVKGKYVVSVVVCSTMGPGVHITL